MKEKMKAKFESKYEKNLKFGVRKVLNPGRDFLDIFLFFHLEITKHADFLIKKMSVIFLFEAVIFEFSEV